MMNDRADKPILVVVTGRPGSGKSTLAHLLSREIHCPLLSRDEFKEGLVNTLGRSHGELLPELGRPEAARRLYETFFGAVEFLLERKISVVIEAAFQHKLWAPALEPLIEKTRLRIVLCTIQPALARERFLKRFEADPARQRFHGDLAPPLAAGAAPAIPALVENYDPPRLAVPTLEVDTSEGYHPTLPEIAAFALGLGGLPQDLPLT